MNPIRVVAPLSALFVLGCSDAAISVDQKIAVRDIDSLIVTPLEGLTTALLDSVSNARQHVAAGRRPPTDSLSIRAFAAWGAAVDSQIAQDLADSLVRVARADSIARAASARRNEITDYFSALLRTADSVLYTAFATTATAARIGMGSSSAVGRSATVHDAGTAAMRDYLVQFQLVQPPEAFRELHATHSRHLRAVVEAYSLVAAAQKSYSLDPDRAIARARSAGAEAMEAMQRSLNSREALDVAFTSRGVKISPLKFP